MTINLSPQNIQCLINSLNKILISRLRFPQDFEYLNKNRYGATYSLEEVLQKALLEVLSLDIKINIFFAPSEKDSPLVKKLQFILQHSELAIHPKITIVFVDRPNSYSEPIYEEGFELNIFHKEVCNILCSIPDKTVQPFQVLSALPLIEPTRYAINIREEQPNRQKVALARATRQYKSGLETKLEELNKLAFEYADSPKELFYIKWYQFTLLLEINEKTNLSVLQQCIDIYEQNNTLDVDIIPVLTMAIECNQTTRNYKTSLKYAELKLSILKKSYNNEQSINIAYSLVKLGNVHLSLRNYPLALEQYLKAQNILNLWCSKNHLDIADINYKFARLFTDMGEFEKAESYYRNALSIYKENNLENFPGVADTLNGLASVLSDQKKNTEAKTHFEKSLSIFKSLYGEHSTSVANLQNNYAKLLTNCRYFEEALVLYNNSLTILERSLGKKHPQTIITLNNIATIYYYQEKYDDALSLLKRVLPLFIEIFGPDDPNVACMHSNIAGLFFDTHKLEKAEIHINKAVEIYRKKSGEQHPQTLYCLKLLKLIKDTLSKEAPKSPTFFNNTPINDSNDSDANLRLNTAQGS